MCEPIKERNISVEFHRDPGLRATEVVLINHDRKGKEKQGFVVYCHDDGSIREVGGRHAAVGYDLVNGVRII